MPEQAAAGDERVTSRGGDMLAGRASQGRRQAELQQVWLAAQPIWKVVVPVAERPARLQVTVAWEVPVARLATRQDQETEPELLAVLVSASDRARET